MSNTHHLIAEILRGSWRSEPDPLSLSETSLAASIPVLASTGAGGLAWNRVTRNPSLRACGVAQELRDASRILALDAVRHDLALGDLAQMFHDNDVEPLLFKGWAISHYYSERRLRAKGDIDLCAPPGQFDALADLFRRQGFFELNATDGRDNGRTKLLTSMNAASGKYLMVDLHEGLDKFFLPPLEEVFARAVRLQAGDHFLLTPAPEDHLRIIAIHFLGDGGWRPSALCDVGAMLEGLPPGFDWELCLGEEPRHRRWVACTLALAQELLGARLDDVPEGCRVRDMPKWLSATVLRAWMKPFSDHKARPLFSDVWRHYRADLVAEILARWPNGIRATIELDADFNDFPRWPYQAAHFSRTIGHFLWRGVRSRLPKQSKIDT
jgi:hypothetical protein